ncbi:MAG: ABC transporter ATP-binding protein [bacterium]
MNKYILNARNIFKSYPVGKDKRLEVLKGINISIKSGEILSIIGPSGVGKSTLLHIMGALDKPDRGDVIINNQNIYSMLDKKLAYFRNQEIGFVFQFHYLLPEFTALENVAMPGLISGKNRIDAFKRAEYLLGKVNLQQRLLHKPNELSGGENQRVAFARSLMNEPLMILADEPSGNLDQANSEFLHEIMWELVREKNKAFVIVTHEKDLANKTDRIIELFDGKVKK